MMSITFQAAAQAHAFLIQNLQKDKKNQKNQKNHHHLMGQKSQNFHVVQRIGTQKSINNYNKKNMIQKKKNSGLKMWIKGCLDQLRAHLTTVYWPLRFSMKTECPRFSVLGRSTTTISITKLPQWWTNNWLRNMLFLGRDSHVTNHWSGSKRPIQWTQSAENRKSLNSSYNMQMMTILWSLIWITQFRNLSKFWLVRNRKK